MNTFVNSMAQVRSLHEIQYEIPRGMNWLTVAEDNVMDSSEEEEQATSSLAALRKITKRDTVPKSSNVKKIAPGKLCFKFSKFRLVSQCFKCSYFDGNTWY